jgi:hypothetical protein
MKGKWARLGRHVESLGELLLNLVMMNRRNHPETPEPKGKIPAHGFLNLICTFPYGIRGIGNN